MDTLEAAIQKISESYEEIDKIEPINQGRNSNVFKLISKGGKYSILKFYKQPYAEDNRDRLQAETKFLNYLKTHNVNNVPRLLLTNPSNNWSLLSHIDGIQLKEVDEKVIKQTIQFIADGNPSENPQLTGLARASEACTSHIGMQKNFELRLNRLIKVSSTKLRENSAFHEWIYKILVPKAKSKLEEFKLAIHSEEWKTEAIQLVASPSDIGIHNMIMGANNKLHFVDFEYAGKDDIAKLLVDFVIQPENPLSISLEKQLLSRIGKAMPYLNGTWRRRYKTLKPLLEIKWCFILCNNLSCREEQNMRLFNKVKAYFQRTAGQ